jgi:hypothetical protein
LAEKSIRSVTAAGMARILLAPLNHLQAKYGIPRESEINAFGIRAGSGNLDRTISGFSA